MARIIDAFTQFLDDSGNPLVSGKLAFFEVGTTTDKNTYSDDGLTIPNTNPVILDGAGRCPNVFGEGTYKVVSFTADDVQIQVFDPVGEGASTGAFGQWDSGSKYSTGDLVRFDNQYYRSILSDNTGNNPATSENNWELLSFGRVWNSTITYARGDTVYGSDGLVYTLKALTSLNNSPVSQTSSANWVHQNELYTVSDTAGTVSIMTASVSNGLAILRDGSIFYINSIGENTSTAPTLNINALGAKTITKEGGQALALGDIAASGAVMILQYVLSSDEFSLLNPAADVEAATQAEQETGTEAGKFVAPATQQYHDSAAKVWASFEQLGTHSLYGSYNVSSLSDLGTGITQVNIATDFSNTNYSSVATSGRSGSTAATMCSISKDGTLSGSFIVRNYNTAGSGIDGFVTCACYGDQ
jgi:hypothetical protein